MIAICTIEITTNERKLLGDLTFRAHPRIGEWVEIDVAGTGTMFEVLMVVHSAQGCGSDIYIRRVDESVKAIDTLLPIKNKEILNIEALL